MLNFLIFIYLRTLRTVEHGKTFINSGPGVSSKVPKVKTEEEFANTIHTE